MALLETRWNAATEAAPTETTSYETIIAGALLPVWKALGAATYRNAVYRLQTDDGHQIVGRPLSAQVIPHFCSMLGTTAAPSESEIDEIVSQLKNGEQVALTTATNTPLLLSGTFSGSKLIGGNLCIAAGVPDTLDKIGRQKVGTPVT